MTHPVSPAPAVPRTPWWHYLHLYMIYVWIPVGLVAFSDLLHGTASNVALTLMLVLLAVEFAAGTRHTMIACPVCRSIAARQTPVGRLGVVASLRLMHAVRRHVWWLVAVAAVLPVAVALVTGQFWVGFVVLAGTALAVDRLARRHRYLRAWCPVCALESLDRVSLHDPGDGPP